MPPTNIIVTMPPGTVAKASAAPDGRRMVYWESTRDGTVDREGEMVAADALWKSRELMLSQGDLDISHWAHLPNPQTGRPEPEYRIGHPTQVTRSGQSIFTAGEIYRPNDGALAPRKDGGEYWPNYFWHSIAEQNPAAKWFPSVYGRIAPGGVEVIRVKGQTVRRIVDVQWFSVGFALRAQHPDLGAVSLSPVGNLLAKADGQPARPDTLQLSWRQLAKACAEVGQTITDHAQLTGVQALMRQSLDGQLRQQVAPAGSGRTQLRVRALKAVHEGRLLTSLSALTLFFQKAGCGHEEARELARELHADIRERSGT